MQFVSGMTVELNRHFADAVSTNTEQHKFGHREDLWQIDCIGLALERAQVYLINW